MQITRKIPRIILNEIDVKYLDQGDPIDEDTFYLNRLGVWMKAEAVGARMQYSDFGRYAKFE